MDIKIDYLSFTIKHAGNIVDGDERLNQNIALLFDNANLGFFVDWLGNQEAERAGGRKIYNASFIWTKHKLRLWFGGSANHILIEMGGEACQAARDAGIFYELLQAVEQRVTRLDIACDSRAFGSPKAFVGEGYNGRFKSSTSMTSATGDTEYVGGTKSERYARVYRYNEPHPRAGITRVEMVMRSDYAKSLAALINSDGLAAAAASCGASFGWLARSWHEQSMEADKLKSKRSDRHSPERLKWIYEAVRPALLRAHREGLLSLPEFVEQLLADINKDR